MEEERNLFDYAVVLVKWRRMIAISVLVVSLGAVVIALTLPKKWQASTSLLPPEEELDQFGLSMLVSSAVPANLGGLMGGGTSGERLATLVGSRKVLGTIVDRFGLVERFEVPHRDLAIEMLDESVERELGRDGAFTIAVEIDDPGLAADIANDLAAELDGVNREFKNHQAGMLRAFLEERMEVVRGEIEGSARELQRFQERHGLVDLEAQTSASVEVIRHIIQELTLLEVELGVSRRQLREDHELRQLKKMEVEELRRQLQLLTGELAEKSEAQAAATFRSLGPPLKELPELGMEYTRLSMEMQIKEQIITFLGAKLEEAKYKEALDTPTLMVLDMATPPAFRSAPRRTLIVLIAGCTSLVLSVVLAFVLEGLGGLNAENRDKIEGMKRMISSPR